MQKDNQSNVTMNGDKALLKNHKLRPRGTLEIFSLHDLSLENFLDTDMNKFNAKVIGTEKKVFAPKDYVIEITISNIPAFKVPKTYNEFKAFYKALKLRFTTIPWPDFPSQFGLFSKDAMKKEVFQQILQNICSGARLKNKNAKALLAIFYAFFLDKDIINKIKQNLPSDPSTPSKTPKSQSEAQNEVDDSKLEGVIEKSIIDFEKRYNYILHQKSTDDLNSFEEVRDPDGSPSLSFKQQSSSPNSYDQQATSLLKQQSPCNNSDLCEVNPSQTEFDPSQEEEIDIDDEINNVVHRRLGNASELASIVSEQRRNTTGNLNPSQEEKGTKKIAIRDIIRNSLKKNNKSMVESLNDSKNGDQILENMEPNNSTSENPRSLLRVSIASEREAKSLLGRKSKKKDQDDELAPRQRARGVSSTCKEIPNFSGPLYMKFSSDTKWAKYFARISGNCLVLYKSILENSPLHYVPVFRSNLKYISGKKGDYLELWHPHDAEKLQVCSYVKDEGGENESEEEEEDDDDENKSSIGMWFEQIKFASEKVAGLDLISNKYNPIGKFQVVIYGVYDLKGLPNNSSCYVRLSHPPFHFSTSKMPKSENLKWKQSFFVPIFDQYFPLTIEVVCAYNDGWIKDNQKEEVICTGEILVPDIMSLNNENNLTLDLPLKYTESKLKTLAKSMNISELESSQPQLEVRIKNLSSFTSLFAPSSDDFVEGVKISDENLSKQLMKLSLSRIKRIITYLSLEAAELEGVFNFKYPFFSYISLLLFTFMITVFEVTESIPTFILLLVLACLYHHPKVHDFISRHMIRFFFQEKHLNPHFVKPRVKTYRDLEIKKLMNTEKWKYRLVDPESLVSVLKKFKHLLVEITIFLTNFAGFFEKVKNIATWQDPTRTLIFIVVGTIGYCFFSVVSLRMLILFGIWAKFVKGIYYYKNMYKKNKQSSEHALRLILKENYLEYYPQVFGNLQGPWPNIPNFKAFQAKIVEKMKERMNLHLHDSILEVENKPADFLAMLATCGRPLKLKMSPAEEASLHIHKEKSAKIRAKNNDQFCNEYPQ